MTKRSVLWIVAGLFGLLVLGAAFVLVDSFVEHRRLSEAERIAYPAPGTLVEVRAGAGEEPVALHVHAEGAGDPTLVFLSGLGTASPYYDFKVLFENLAANHRVAVVERAGYGWSEISDSPRDLATVVAQSRAALSRAGESPPYVLFPHSLAGLEAIHWANAHPGEIVAIVGLDPLVPNYIAEGGAATPLSRLETILARTGLMRQGPDIFARNFPAMVKGRLSPREAEIAETVFMRRTHTPDMWDEVRAVPENAALVESQGVPEAPFHAFVSERGSEAWIESVAKYADAAGGEVFLLDAGHYLHLDRPDRIAEISRRLIEAAVSG